MEEESNVHQCDVSSTVEFEMKLDDFISRRRVQVRIDSEDNVTLSIPDDFMLEDNRLTTVTLQTTAKVKVLPDILSTRFGSESRHFYAACSVLVNVEFTKYDSLFRCSHCGFTINRNDVSSKEELTEILLQHLPQHQDYLPCLRFSCKKCTHQPPSVVSLNTLITHFEDTHPDLLVKNGKEFEPEETSEKTELTCPICSVICFNTKTLAKHVNDYHSSDSKNTSQILPNPDEMQNGIEVSIGVLPMSFPYFEKSC